MARRWGAAALALLTLSGLAAGVAGCGESESVAAGATVHVYVAAPLCEEAQSALDAAHGRAGDVRVKTVCLHAATIGTRLDLATVGSNARRATQDSTAVAFLEAEGRGAPFARTIVEEADIAFVESSSGEAAMRRILKAVTEAGSGSLRSSVREALE